MRLAQSIKFRFTVWYLAVLAILLIGLSFGVYTYLSHTLHRNLDRALIHRSAQLIGTRDIQQVLADSGFEEALGEIIGFYTKEEDSFTLSASTREISHVVDLEWVETAISVSPVFVTTRAPDGTQLRLYLTPFYSPGSRQNPPPGSPPGSGAPPVSAEPSAATETPRGEQAPPPPMVLVVGQPMGNIVSALGTLRRTLFLAGPLTLLLSAGGGLFLARRALKPVDRMIQTTRKIEETDLSRRIDVKTNDELGRLAATLNAMLERLERAFHRQRQFTDDASHELRTPLSVIEAEASLALRRKRPADDYRDALAIVVDEAKNMNRLIDQLLTLARADASQDTLDLELVDLAEIAWETIATMMPLAEEKDVTLTTGSMASVVVNGDRARLKRLLVNLIDNAIRYTQSGGTVTVSVKQNSDSVEFTVTDTGIGIPAGHLPQIFERFYRVDKARSRAEGGSGLGLSICKQIAEEHGGSISVESEEGEGTKFAVRVPRA